MITINAQIKRFLPVTPNMLKFTLLVSSYILLVSGNPVKPDIDWRVVGGSNAGQGQYPFIISLRTASNSHTCGGSLIRNDWVITAAHCVVNTAPTSLSIVAGINQLNAFSGLQVQLARIIVNPNYNSSTSLDDVALLQLESSIVETDLVQLIELETENIDTPRDVVLIGWGRTSYPGNIPNDLQQLNSRTIPNEQCRSAWSGISIVESTQICTLTQRGEGACHGDSGGPLISIVNGTPRLVGLVSWGAACAVGYPDVYARVSAYVSWIDETVN